MSGLAPLCGMTRRALYHHFSNKAEAFRYMLRDSGERSILVGMAAGRRALEAGGSVLDIVTAIMDMRYGEARRLLGTSPHAAEINDHAFRLARDVMVEHATAFQAQLAELIVELQQRRLLAPKPAITPEILAQLLCDAARGTNQTLPPIPASELSGRYRLILSAILYGATTGTS